MAQKFTIVVRRGLTDVVHRATLPPTDARVSIDPKNWTAQRKRDFAAACDWIRENMR